MNEKEAKSVQAVLDKRNYRVSVLKHQKFAKLPLYDKHKTCVLVHIHVKKNLTFHGHSLYLTLQNTYF